MNCGPCGRRTWAWARSRPEADGLYVRLDDLTRGLDELTRKLKSPEGTAGRLLEDAALYENMRDAVADVRLLIRDIRNDPKRYLNVKVSLF